MRGFKGKVIKHIEYLLNKDIAAVVRYIGA